MELGRLATTTGASLRNRTPAPAPALIRLSLLMRRNRGASGVLCAVGAGGVILCRGARRSSRRLWRAFVATGACFCRGLGTRMAMLASAASHLGLWGLSDGDSYGTLRGARLAARRRTGKHPPLLRTLRLRHLACCAGPKLHPATPGSSKQLLSLLRPAETRNPESFAALAAKKAR